MIEGTAAIFGATSRIARWSAAELAKHGWKVILCGRDTDELSRIAADLQIRSGVEVKVVEFHADDIEGMPAFWDGLKRDHEDLKGALVAYGMMEDQADLNAHPEKILATLDVNFISPCLLCQLAARDFEAQGSGWIIGISSVAGDRGRQGNYVYGSAKGGFTVFLSGLRARLAKSNVRVITVKPGFVDTVMTWGRPGVFLAANPRAAGEKIADTIERHADVVYVPGFWRIIMAIIRAIPESVFKRMKF